MSIDELLRETLDERAARVGGDEDLATNVLRRSRNARTRGAVVGLSTLAVVVIVVVLTLTQMTSRNTAVVPDPRATASPSVGPGAPQSSISGVSTTYRILQGPVPTLPTVGTPIAVTPRVERRGAATWLVTPTTSVALPPSVNQARSIQPAGSGWVVFTVSTGYTGGDTDLGAQILVVSSSGTVVSFATGALRSVAVSPDGAQVAYVETVETSSTWSVTLVVRRIADGGVVRKVALPYGQRGEWPYSALAWTPVGIFASNQSGAVTAPGGTVLVRGDSVTEEAPITGIYRDPASADLYVTSSSAGSTCLGYAIKATTTPATSATILCGHLGAVTPLENGRVLVLLADTDGKQAVLADTVAGTLTLLTMPPGLQLGYTVGFPAESGTSVLVLDVGNNVWWRWKVLTNAVETAPFPSGTNAVLSW
jgi:hypothetical protein